MNYLENYSQRSVPLGNSPLAIVLEVSKKIEK